MIRSSVVRSRKIRSHGGTRAGPTGRSQENQLPSITVMSTAWHDIMSHAREARPNECCGLLLGAGTRIERAHRARNIDERPTRFLIDPQDHFAAIRAARASGRTVLGVYHSHPSSPANPSPADVAEASYGEYLYLIVSLAKRQPDIRAFRLREGDFVEQPLVFDPGGSD